MEENNITTWNYDSSVDLDRKGLPESVGSDTKTFRRQLGENIRAVGGDETNLADWLSGNDKQLQAQAFEMTMQERQWAYDHPVAQMERMKEAGINPNLAAGGIAGGNQSAPAPSSPVSSGNGAEAIGSIASLAGGFSSVASGISELGQLEGRKNKLRAEYSDILENMGLTKLKSKSLAIQIEYLPEKERLGILRAMSDIENVDEQTKVYRQQVANMKEEIDEIRERVKLYKSQSNMADKLAAEAEEKAAVLALQKYEQEWVNGFIEKYGVNPSHPIMQQLSSLSLGGRTSEVETLFNMIYDYQYNMYKGQFDADIDTIFQREWNAALAKEEVEIGFAPIKTKLQSILEGYKAYYKALGEQAKNPVDFILRNIIVPMIKASLNGEVFDFDSLGLPNNKSPKTSKDDLSSNK